MSLYYHADGLAMLYTACASEDECDGVDDLRQRAEGALRDRLSALDLGGVLPPGAESCETESIDALDNGGAVDAFACDYGTGPRLMLMRLSKATTNADLVSQRTRRL